MTARNDPCPCGSGRKYKRCCLARDAAERPELRVLRSGRAKGAGGAGGERNLVGDSVRDQPVSGVWQAEMAPMLTGLGDDPAARPVIVMVAADDLVLHADILAHPPAEVAAIAAELSLGVASACKATGRTPQTVEVRFADVAAALRLRLQDRGIKVRTAETLPAVDAALAGMDQHMGAPQARGAAPRMSRPATWAGWGLDAAQIGRFFAACAAYYRAAPWVDIVNGDVIRARVLPHDRTWSVTVMGNAAEVYGLALYARAADLDELLAGHPNRPGETMARMRGAILSLAFDHQDEVPREMRKEIRAARWEIAGPGAWPGILVINTPGGGITGRQMDDLIAVIESVPRFAATCEGVLAGRESALFPLQWHDSRNGVAIEFEGSDFMDGLTLDGAKIGGNTGEVSADDERAIVLAMFDRHYREWLDIPVPALGNRTPRHAARLKTVRPQLVALLREMDAQALRDREAGRPAYDSKWMWGELGLERGLTPLTPETD